MTPQPNIYPLGSFELVAAQNWFEEVRHLTAAARQVAAGSKHCVS
jgi:hypothetical protein